MLDEVIIQRMDIPALFSTDTLNELYDITDNIEHERLKVFLCEQAKTLKCLTGFKEVLKVYDKELEKLNAEYRTTETINKSNNPGVWQKLNLDFDKKQPVINCTENYLTILQNDLHFFDVKYNALTNSPEINNARWTDTDDASARNYIEREYDIYNAAKLDDALRIFFQDREYHPIKEIIESIKWDGKERIANLLHLYMRAEDNEYTREVSRLIFAGGIHRLYEPGCKFDEVPVLIGTKQGEGKSTFVRWLALKDDFFTEVCEIEGQKGAEAIEGAWVCEIAELLALTRSKDVEAAKSFLTKQKDHYRRPYDRRTSEYPRQCIFIGTTNKRHFLIDKTGNRRFYPVEVHQDGSMLFKWEYTIKADIRQCWAEALHKYRAGELKPYVDLKLRSIIKEQQNAAVEDDYRIGIIEDYLDRMVKSTNNPEVCIIELWEKALNMEHARKTRKDADDIAVILNKLGWTQHRQGRTSNYGKQNLWKPASSGISADS